MFEQCVALWYTTLLVLQNYNLKNVYLPHQTCLKLSLYFDVKYRVKFKGLWLKLLNEVEMHIQSSHTGPRTLPEETTQTTPFSKNTMAD